MSQFLVNVLRGRAADERFITTEGSEPTIKVRNDMSDRENFRCRRRGEPQQQADSVRVVFGKGIEGDRNFGKIQARRAEHHVCRSGGDRALPSASGLAIDMAQARGETS